MRSLREVTSRSRRVVLQSSEDDANPARGVQRSEPRIDNVFKQYFAQPLPLHYYTHYTAFAAWAV